MIDILHAKQDIAGSKIFMTDTPAVQELHGIYDLATQKLEERLILVEPLPDLLQRDSQQRKDEAQVPSVRTLLVEMPFRKTDVSLSLVFKSHVA